jgi:hypothetical protein
MNFVSLCLQESINVLELLRPHLIANDDDFESTSWPVTAVINDQPFHGALVILVERSVDPDAPPLQGDTFLDGLTAHECQQVLLSIKSPAGASLRYRL